MYHLILSVAPLTAILVGLVEILSYYTCTPHIGCPAESGSQLLHVPCTLTASFCPPITA